MAEEILGISGHFDISEIISSLNNLYGEFGRLQNVSQKTAEEVKRAYNELANATQENIAQKSKDAINVFSRAFEEAKNSAETNVTKIESSIERLQSKLAKISVERSDTVVGTKTYDNLTRQMESVNTQIHNQQQALALARVEAQSAGEAYSSFLANVGTANSAIEAFNAVNTIATGTTVANTSAHGAAAVVIGAETAQRASNTLAIEKGNQAKAESVALIQEETNAENGHLNTMEEFVAKANELVEKFHQARDSGAEWTEVLKMQLNAMAAIDNAKLNRDDFDLSLTRSGGNVEKIKEEVEERKQLTQTVKENKAEVEDEKSKTEELTKALEEEKRFLDELISRRLQIGKLSFDFQVPRFLMTDEVRRDYDITIENIRTISEELEKLKAAQSNSAPTESASATSRSYTEVKDSIAEATAALEQYEKQRDKLLEKKELTAKDQIELERLNKLIVEAKEEIRGYKEEQKKLQDESVIGTVRGWFQQLGDTISGAKGKLTEFINEKTRLATEKFNNSAFGKEFVQAKEGINDVTSAIGNFLTGHGKVQDALSQMGSAFGGLGLPLGAATKGVGQFAKALLTLSMTPVGAVIAAIALALKALTTWFNKSVEGQMAFAKISAVVSSVLGTLTDIVVIFGEYLFHAFADAGAPMHSFAKSLVTTFKTAIKAVSELVGGLGNTLKGIFTFNWETFKQGVSQMGSGLLDAGKTMIGAFETSIKGTIGAIRTTYKAITDDSLSKKLGEKFSSLTKNAALEASLAEQQFKNQKAAAEAREHSLELDKQIAANREKIYTLTGKEKDALIEQTKQLLRQKYEGWTDEQGKQHKGILETQREELRIAEQRNGLHSKSLQQVEQERSLRERILQTEAQQLSSTRMLTRMQAANQRAMNNAAKQGAKRDAKQSADVLKADAKISELAYKNEEERIKAEKELEEKVADARIAAMREGSAKTLAEREREKKKELDAIEQSRREAIEAERKRQKEEFEAEQALIKARGGNVLQWDNKNFEETDYVKKINSSYDELRLQAVERQLNEEKDLRDQYLRDFLKQYGDYEQQRLAISEEYAQKIAVASTVAEKASLASSRDKELKELESKKLEDSIDWAGVFNDLSGHTKEYLEGLRDQLQKILATGNLPIDQMETIQGKIREINEAINEQGGMFAYANEQQREHVRRVEEAKNAQELYNQALAEQRGIEADITMAMNSLHTLLGDKTFDFSDMAKDQEALERIGKIYGKNSEEYKKAEKTLVRLRTQEGKLTEARENTQKRWNGWKKAEDGANEALKDSIARVAGNIKDWCNEFLGDLPELLSQIGLGSIGEKVGQGLSAVNNAAGAAADFASGNYVGAALKGLNAVKDFGRVLGIGGGNAAEINKQLARLSERNEILTQSIDKLTDAMNGKGGAGAIKEYMKVAEMQKELEENLIKQMQLQMSYHSAHGSFNKYWGSGFSASEIDAFNKRHGTNWSGNLNDLTADLAALLMGEADMWQKINDTGKGGYGERVAEKIKELAEQAGKAKEQTDALYASLTAGTTRENVFDDFLNSLYDLADGSEDVMENIEKNWQQMVNHMVINNLIGEKLRERLSGWYDQLAQLNMERTKEGSTMSDDYYKSELERLQKLYQSYVQEGADQIEQFRDMGIIKSVQDAAEEAKKYFEDLRNSWASTLTDMTATADDWKQQLLSTVFSDLVESTILSAPFDAMIDGAQKHFDDFDAYLEDWKKRYKAIIEDTTLTDEQRNARLKALIDEQTTLRDDQAQRSKELAEGIGYEITESLSNSLDNLGDTILNSLLSVSDDAADMGKEIASTLIKEMLQTMLASEQYASQMDAIRKKWQQVLSGKNTDEAGNVLFTMDDVLLDIADLNNAIASDEGIKALAEQYHILNEEVGKADETLKGMSGDFKSSLMNLDGTAEEWAKSVGQKMAEKIIDEMVTASMLQPFLDNLQDAFNTAMSVEGATIDGVLAQIAPQIDAAKQAFNEAQPTVQKILAALGITKKVETPFGDLRSTFLSTLTDMESDAETFGKEIGKTLIEQMIDAQLKQQFQDKLDDLNSAWAVALQNGDTTAIATIRQQMVELREDAAQAVKPLLDDLKALEDIENPFADLRSSFLSSLQDLESDTKKFGTQMTENLVGQMMDEILSKNGLQEKIDELGVEWRKALDAGDTTAIDGIIAKMGALRDESAKAVEPLIEKLKSLDEVVLDTPLNNLRSSFLSDLMSMEDSTEDFVDNINKILTEAFVDKFVLGKAFDEQLEKWEKRYAEIMEADINEADRAKQLQDLQQSIGVAREHYTEQARAIQELMGYTNKEALADQEAHVNMADKATYDQFELYLGIATAQQIALEQGNDVRRQILTTLQTMSGITSPNGDTVKEIRSMLRTTNEHLYAIKTATEGIRAEFMPRLQSIDNKLNKL